jgi:fibronectin-binding autotransporter adhesin
MGTWVRRFALAVLGILFVAMPLALSPLHGAAAGTVVDTCTDALSHSGTSLRDAIGSAGVGATITFSVDCPPNNPIILTQGTLSLAQDVTIDGAGHTIAVDGNNGATVFTIGAVNATLNRLTIQHGGNAFGGGISNNGGTLTVAGSTLSGNSASQSGGGVYNSGTLTITSSTLSGNSAAAGGGGGIFNLGGTLTVTSSTLSGNSANNGGGGGIDTVNATATLTDTIVANSTNGDLSQFNGGFNGTNNLIGDGSGGIVGSNANISGNPKLGPLDFYGGTTQTFPLLTGSPALDAGAAVNSGPTGNKVPATDQRGLNRVNAPDIGAFESQGTSACVVNSTADPAEFGKTTLSDAVALANLGACPNNNTVTFDSTAFPPGTPTTINVKVDRGPFELSYTDGPTTIDGTGHKVVLDGGNATAIFAIDSGVNATLNTLTIQHGQDSDVGSAIINDGGTLTVLNSTLRENGGSGGFGEGGAIFSSSFDSDTDATLIVSNSTFTANTAGSGFGGAISADGTLIVTNSTFTDNTASVGGAIDLEGGTAQITGSTFARNQAVSTGLDRAAAPKRATATVSRTGAKGKTAITRSAPTRTDGFRQSGGALFVCSCTNLVLSNSTLSGNTATVNGGAILNEGGLTLANVTIGGNSAQSGGGIFSQTIVPQAVGNGLVATNTLIAGNTLTGSGGSGPDVNGAFGAGSLNNLIGIGDGSSGLANGTNGNQVGTSAGPINPLLGALADNGGPTQTMALLPGSPAIDTGTDTVCGQPQLAKAAGKQAPTGPVDQRGVTRPQGAHCDIGAFEARFTLTISGGGTQSTAINQPFAQPLAVTLGGPDAPANASGATVTYTVTPAGNGATATLSGPTATTNASGVASVTATANGTVGGPYSVTASTPGAASVAFSLTNTNTITRIVVTYKGSTTPTIKVGESGPFVATAVYQDNTTADITNQVTWSGNNAPVATVDATGKILGISPGTLTVTATQGALSGQAVTTVGPGTGAGVAPAAAPSGRPSGTTGQPAPTAGPTPKPAPSSR